MRPDGLPLFFDQVWGTPNPPDGRQDGNLTIDQFGHLVAQCMWMHQGRFKPIDVAAPDIIQLPFALVPLKEGMKMYNYRTGTEYRIKTVVDNYRDRFYSEPKIKDTPESVLIKPRKWFGFYSPDELTGATVQLEGEVWDLDTKQGDFLSLESSARIGIRQAFGETRDFAESGYEIRYRVERHSPGSGREFQGDPKGIKPARRTSTEIPTNDPTVVAAVNAQTFDAIVGFELKANSALELNILTQWFEVFMDRYTSVFEREGFNRVLYVSRTEGEDLNLNKPGTGAERKVRYGVRSERIWPGVMPTLRQVDLEIKAKKDQG